MHGNVTMERLNREAAEAAEIMARKGYVLPDFAAASAESVKNGRVETVTHIPLGATPAEREALLGGDVCQQA